MLVLGVTPEKAPDEDVELAITFEAGKPVALNGEKMKFSALLEKLMNWAESTASASPTSLKTGWWA